MKSIKTGTVLLVIAFVVVCAFSVTSFAAEKKSFKEASKDAARAAVDYPANLVNETVNVVGTAAKDTVDIVVDTAKATGETLAGDPTKAKKIVTTPVNKSVEAGKNVVVGTVEAPMKAGEKTAEQIQ